MKDFILAVDAGTTSSRAIIFDRNGTTIGTSQHEFTQHFEFHVHALRTCTHRTNHNEEQSEL